MPTAIEPLNPTPSKPSARADENGAVMVMGLFLALAVLAGIGCVIGIGDALVARDRSQEAADSAAFASAVMHARGMNFIALINLVLLAWTMLYVFLCWVDLFLSFSLVLITGLEQYQFTCGLRYLSALVDIDVNWCGIAGKLQKLEGFVFKGDQKVFAGLKKVAPPLFETQVFASTAIPYIGLFSGMEVASEYDRAGMAMSLSMIPGGGAKPPLNELNVLLDKIPGVQRTMSDGKAASLLQDRRIGLPVEAEAASALCVRGSRLILEVAKESLSDIPKMGWLKTGSSEEPFGTLFSGAFQSVGAFNKNMFCSEKGGDYLKRDKPAPITKVHHQKWWSWKDYLKDALQKLSGPMLDEERDALRLQLKLLMFGIKGSSNDKFYLQADEFWKVKWPTDKPSNDLVAGPKRVPSYAYNGSDWFQVWGLVTTEEAPDQAAKVVSLPARLFGSAKEQAPPESQRFIAQAEFYFDCPTVWQSIECNKGSAALYQMSWRARLRRVHSINIVGDALEVLLNNLVNGGLARKWGDDTLKKLSKFKIFESESVREGSAEALRTDVQKIMNHRVFTGDHSSHELLH